MIPELPCSQQPATCTYPASVHALPSYFFKEYFNIIPTFTPISSKHFLTSGFPIKILYFISLLSFSHAPPNLMFGNQCSSWCSALYSFLRSAEVFTHSLHLLSRYFKEQAAPFLHFSLNYVTVTKRARLRQYGIDHISTTSWIYRTFAPYRECRKLTALVGCRSFTLGHLPDCNGASRPTQMSTAMITFSETAARLQALKWTEYTRTHTLNACRNGVDCT